MRRIAIAVLLGLAAAALAGYLLLWRGDGPPLRDVPTSSGNATYARPAGVTPAQIALLAQRHAPAYVFHPDERAQPIAVEKITKYGAGKLPVVYWMVGGGHGTRNGREDPAFTIQYWAYHPYDEYEQPGPDGKHDGDWERVAVEFETARVASFGSKALPARIHYGHHEPHEELSFLWGDRGNVKLAGETHPLSYVALGSHGNWPSCGRHKRDKRFLTLDFYDETAPCGTKPTAVELRRMPDRGWSCYRGRWGGDNSVLRGRSPYGPLRQQEVFGNAAHC